jgi:hypothetical protein
MQGYRYLGDVQKNVRASPIYAIVLLSNHGYSTIGQVSKLLAEVAMEKADDRSITIREYEPLLRLLGKELPNLGKILLTAAENLVKILSCHLENALSERIPFPYLKGLEETFQYLDTIFLAFENHPMLTRIAFLVKRARGDFEIAFHSTLISMNSVVMDQMRDIMEIEYLIYDFIRDINQIDSWLKCTSKERSVKFSPAKLRERHAQQLKISPKSMHDYHNYKLHSEMLHTTPLRVFDDFSPKGFAQVSDLEGAEFGFWEIFEHARRLVFALHDLGQAVVGTAWVIPNPQTELPNLRDSYYRSQAVLYLFINNDPPKG